jgi:ribonuclease P/MRP protein subunit RPP40
MTNIVVPINNSTEAISDAIYEEQLLEWIGMVTLGSPRVRPNSIDRYLCRYDLPEAFDMENSIPPKPQSLVRLRWHGFAPANFVLRTWLVPKAALGEHWFAMHATAFGEASYAILCAKRRDVLLWQCE